MVSAKFLGIAIGALAASALLWIAFAYIGESLWGGLAIPFPVIVLAVGLVFGLAIAIIVRYLGDNK